MLDLVADFRGKKVVVVGDYVLDPNSEVYHILREKRVFIQLKEEVGNNPRFYYYFDV